MIRPKIETEGLFLSSARNCETLIKQTHTQPQETLEFKLTQTKETFHFNPTIAIERSWLIGLGRLELYNSIFNITGENTKFELYEFPDSNSGGISCEKVREEIEKNLEVSDITATNLQHEIISPIFNEAYEKKYQKEGKVIII